MKRPGLALACLPALVLAALASGCASGPESDSSPIVTRTSRSTTWVTPEALAADAAAAEAAAARRSPRAAAPAAAAASVPAAAASGASAAPAPVPVPAEALLPSNARFVFFEFDRSEIRPEFLPLIERHARRLANDRDLRLALEGHADERGGAEYNLALGQRRAEAVLRALVAAGAQESQLEALSFGDTRPLVPGHDERAWSQNRRVEVKDR